MREHKYRAWDNTAKDIGGQRMIDWEELNSLDKDDLVCIMDVFMGITKDVIPLEYIGLKDKNGKEGYHKDVVESKNKWLIEWSDTEAGFYLKSLEGYDKLPARKLREMKIIGSSYEYPELLERNNQ